MHAHNDACTHCRHVVDVLREVCGTKVDDNTLGKLKQLVKFQFEHILAMTVLERDLSSPDLTGRNRWSRRSSTLTENQNVCVSLLRSTVCEDFFVENCLMQLMQQDSIERSPAVNRSLWALAGVADLMLLIRHAHTLARSDPDIDHSIPDTSSTFLLALDGKYTHTHVDTHTHVYTYHTQGTGAHTSWQCLYRFI